MFPARNQRSLGGVERRQLQSERKCQIGGDAEAAAGYARLEKWGAERRQASRVQEARSVEILVFGSFFLFTDKRLYHFDREHEGSRRRDGKRVPDGALISATAANEEPGS